MFCLKQVRSLLEFGQLPHARALTLSQTDSEFGMQMASVDLRI